MSWEGLKRPCELSRQSAGSTVGGAVSCCRAEAQETSQGSDAEGHPDPFGIADKRPQTTAGELRGGSIR